MPQITNVTISGSTSTHDPFSFDDPADDVNDFDGSGIQLRTVPVGGADTISLQFSEHVMDIDANSLALQGLAIGQAPQLATDGFSFNPVTHTGTWTYDSPFSADQFHLSLSDSVTDVGENQLDGEWINPFSITTSNSSVSTFPSGDGTQGGDFNFVFTILPGDASLDNTANGTDFISYYQPNIGGPGRTFAQADYNGDGYTDSADNALWNANYGTDLTDLVFSDYNGDGIVNGSDYSIWSANYGTGDEHSEGDGNLDGAVDGQDYMLLSRHFGLELDWVA